MDEKSIDIIGFQEEQSRGVIRDLKLALKSIELKLLKNNLCDFIKKVDDLVDELPSLTKEYQLDTIEIGANISASGKVSLLGCGGEANASGGIKFILKKKSTTQKKDALG